MFDLSVCGAGPVGSFLAWKFSEKGFKTFLIEEHKKPGLPLACSGLVSKKIWSFVPKRKKLIERNIKGARLHVKNKTYTFRSQQAVLINRAKVDEYLFNIAKSSGVETLVGERLSGFLEKEGSVSLYTPNKGKIETKILAGCDGPLSTVRSYMGVDRPNLLHAIFCYTDEKPDNFVDLYFRETPDFFAWRTPRSDSVEYGLASKSNAKKYFKKFTQKNRITPKKIFSGLIPYGLIPKITSERVFLCGDAAAHVKPHTGGGLIYGLKCAEIAAKTIDPNNPKTYLYEKHCKKELKQEILFGKLIKKYYRVPVPLFNIALFLLSKKQNLDMDAPSSIFG